MNRAERIKNTFFKAKKQAIIAKSKGFIVTSIHRYAKHHAMDCGNPHCGICGNPRRINKELTMQERKAQEDARRDISQIGRDRDDE